MSAYAKTVERLTCKGRRGNSRDFFDDRAAVRLRRSGAATQPPMKLRSFVAKIPLLIPTVLANITTSMPHRIVIASARQPRADRRESVHDSSRYKVIARLTFSHSAVLSEGQSFLLRTSVFHE
jgi:hypothetical protein